MLVFDALDAVRGPQRMHQGVCSHSEVAGGKTALSCLAERRHSKLELTFKIRYNTPGKMLRLLEGHTSTVEGEQRWCR